MGAKSTIDIKKDEAINFIITALLQADNETLARMVEELNDSLYQQGDYENSLGLHNFQIVD